MIKIIFKSSEVTGNGVAGALAGATFELNTNVDTKQALIDGLSTCWNTGIKHFLLTTTRFDIYDAPRLPPVAQGDGTSPGRKVVVPAGRAYHETISLTNSGETVLNSLTVADRTAAPNTTVQNLSCEKDTLAVGESTTCGADVTLKPGTDLNTNVFEFGASTPKGSKIRLIKEFYTSTAS
jgi:hypothetical protein